MTRAKIIQDFWVGLIPGGLPATGRGGGGAFRGPVPLITGVRRGLLKGIVFLSKRMRGAQTAVSTRRVCVRSRLVTGRAWEGNTVAMATVSPLNAMNSTT